MAIVDSSDTLFCRSLTVLLKNFKEKQKSYAKVFRI